MASEEAVKLQDPVEDEFTFDMSMKKKKKKKKPADEAEETSQVAEGTANGDTVAANLEGADKGYSYEMLLNRVFSLLRQNNPELSGEKRKFTIVPPQISREGSKKTGFANIVDLSRRMRRPVEHLTQFLLTELGTTGSTDASQRLLIKGRFQQLQIENVLRRYIMEYVTCKTCHSPETLLVKENRLYFLRCESCGSSRSVAAIKSGFQAQTTRRAATRQ